MRYIRIALAGIATFVLVAALFVACTSSEDQSQQQQTQEDTSRAETTQSDDEDQAQPQRAEQDEQQSAAAIDQAIDEEQTAPKTTESDDAQEQEAAVAAADQQEDEAQTEPAQHEAQDQAQQQQAEDEPAQQQDQTQPQAESTDDQQQSQADDEAQQQAQPEAEPADQQDEPAEQEEQSDPSETERLRLRAEEISAEATVSDLVGINAWLNGAETTIALERAKGNIVLIDFWTYTCINCVRTLPFLTAWDEKYREHGLVIIGVHTPEFEFEERLENVRAANAEHGVEYLVAIDNDYATWRVLQGRRGFWPRKFLIGPTPDSPMGVRYDHIGEGDYEETEVQIRAALEAVGRDLSDVPFGVDVAIPERSAAGRQTRELYAGWSRNNGSGGPYAGQEAYFLAGPLVPTFYSDIPTSDRQHNLWYLQGLWETDRESIVHARTTTELEDYIALLVRGRTANVVLTVAEDGQPYDVFVELDGRWLRPNEAGAHIQWDDEGRSFIRVTENDLYRLIFLPEWSEHELKLRSDSDQFRIFAFTFGSYVGGE